jgi:hypothetical protein
MRKLGEALGVEAMSLYNHVASKGDLLDGMIDLVFSEIGLPPADPAGRRPCAGDTLITDSINNRILIVTHGKKVVFDYPTNHRHGSMAMPLPTRAVMLSNGDILISDQFNDQVIEINMFGRIVFSQGKIQVDGHGFDRLNAPYDAKVIGDFTGLTPPFGFED